jgi:hypothetical protein
MAQPRLTLAHKTLIGMVVAGATSFFLNVAAAAVTASTTATDHSLPLWGPLLIALLLILVEWLVLCLVPSKEEAKLALHDEAESEQLRGRISCSAAVSKARVRAAESGDLKGFREWGEAEQQ